MQEPTDLVPLPTMPYDERPVSLPLIAEEVRTAIWRAKGNVSTVAALLKVSSARVRKFIRDSPYLSAELRESAEIVMDKAEEVVVKAIESEDPTRADQMARWYLGQQGASRGYGNDKGGRGPALSLPGKGRMVIQWDDGEQIVGPLIEHQDAAE